MVQRSQGSLCDVSDGGFFSGKDTPAVVVPETVMAAQMTHQQEVFANMEQPGFEGPGCRSGCMVGGFDEEVSTGCGSRGLGPSFRK